MSGRHWVRLDPIPPPPSLMGIVAVDLYFKVTAEEMREWPPAIIERFFGGIAMATDARREGQRHARTTNPESPL